MVNMQVEILDHEYTAWKFQALIVEPNNPNYDLNFEMKTKLNPLELKLISGDIVNNQGEIQTPSPYRGVKEIPGILVLNGKTFGRASTIAKEAIKEVIKEEINDETKVYTKEEKKAMREEKKALKEEQKALKEAQKEAKKALPKEKKSKLLYKFIPDSKEFPIFLVPYEEKSATFNKKKINRFALLKFKEWTDTHPVGVLTNILGAVNEMEVYYDYQMYCKGLNVSLTKFIDETQKALEIAANETISSNSTEKIEDRISQGNEMFTIDPEGCDDYDDAFSVQAVGEYTLISIHIANVPLLLDSLGLWEYFTDRVSTIYLPNGKKSMLPPILSDKLCSLQAGKERLAFTMDIKVYNDGSKKHEIYFASNLIKVARNYVYEEPDLLVNASYIKLLALAKKMNNISNYLDTVNDSHDVVAYFMIFMNHECSKILMQKRIGINRSTTLGYYSATYFHRQRIGFLYTHYFAY
jgi:exoribonuclease R